MIIVKVDAVSAELGFGKVHFRMRLHELLHDVLLLLLLARRLSHLLLPLIVHHLLHHRSCLPVQIRQLGKRVSGDKAKYGYSVRVDCVETRTTEHRVLRSNSLPYIKLLSI